MNVALIDDGVQLNNTTIEYVHSFFEINDMLDCTYKKTNDVNLYSHATICAAIIRKFTKSAQIYSIKILDPNNLSTSTAKLIKAFEWCIHNNIKIINLSLGTINSKDFILIHNWVRLLTQKGIIIIAAINNNNTYTMPASLHEVIGVSSEAEMCTFKFINNSNIGIDILASSRHYIQLNEDVYITTPFCNSYAAPSVTGMICELLTADSSHFEISDKHFLNQMNLKLNKIFKYENKETSVKYALENLVAINQLEELNSLKSVPIIRINCSDRELERLNERFYNDNIFPIIIYDDIPITEHVSTKHMSKLLKHISGVTDCDLIIMHNISQELVKEDLLIEFSAGRIWLLYKKIFKEVKKSYHDIDTLCLNVLKLLK